MSDLFRINLNCVILGTDIPANKKYVLSTDNKEILFPRLQLTIDKLSNLEENIISFVKNHIFVSDIYLLPQLINFHSQYFKSGDNVLDVVYGFVVEYTPNIDKSFWIEFDFLKPIPQSELLYEVIQKLQ